MNIQLNNYKPSTGAFFYHVNVKALLILSIAAFLVIFNLLPMCYLVFRSFFGENGFSLDAFRRIYTYPLNWNALRNTLIASVLSMIFGVMIAFPLAWLIGRTDIYGKKFFTVSRTKPRSCPHILAALCTRRNPKH